MKDLSQSTKSRIYAALFFILLMAFFLSDAHQVKIRAQATADWRIITLGVRNTTQWKNDLKFNAYRNTCSDTPEACINRLLYWAGVANLNIIHGNFSSDPATYGEEFPQKLIDYAQQYGELTQSQPKFHEIGIDDFIREYKIWAGKTGDLTPAEVLDQVINNIKANPDIKFGATVYEDELDSPELIAIPANIRSKFDYIHLYVHHRKNGLNYENDLNVAKNLFPGALIIAGSYAYDRIDYMSCDDTGPFCTQNEELSLYKDLIQTQSRLYKEGKIYAIEFCPAYFGDEEQWPKWPWNSSPPNYRFCDTQSDPTRKDRCIDNTKKMRQDAITVINSYRYPLRLNKTVDKQSAASKETLTYAFSYQVGVEMLNNVTIEDIIPSGTTYIQGSASGGIFHANLNKVIWNLNNLAPNTSGTLTFQVKVD